MWGLCGGCREQAKICCLRIWLKFPPGFSNYDRFLILHSLYFDNTGIFLKNTWFSAVNFAIIAAQSHSKLTTKSIILLVRS
jgi:hypothetical protein